MRGHCDVCGAWDRLETRKLVGTGFDLCQACRDVADDVEVWA